MLLKNLLKNISNHDGKEKVKGLCLDSRQLKKGDVFFVYQGYKTDGYQFIADVIKKGAVAVLYQPDESFNVEDLHADIPLIAIDNLRQKIGVIAARFYNSYSEKTIIVGVTGTNGKSSICHLLAQALVGLKKKVAVMGTIGNGLWGDLKAASRTTADVLTVHQNIAAFIKKKVQFILLEVSSHALDQGRINAVHFDYVVFTNLTRDHLDYHQTMEAYAACKKRLFDAVDLKAAIINEDDEYGALWIREYAEQMPVCAYSMTKRHPHAHVCVEQFDFNMQGMVAQLKTPWGEGELCSPLLGQFNLSNLLAVFGVLGMLGFAFPAILKQLNQLTSIEGRMQTLGGNGKPLVVIDYAHTPDALAQALSSLDAHRQGKLICMFGCGGDRDRGKRAQMARVAEQYADYIIVTDDNPRSEASAQIINDIVAGFDSKAKVQIMADRKRAIQLALEKANVNDIVLLAGKGHERYQEINGEFLPFDEREMVRIGLGIED